MAVNLNNKNETLIDILLTKNFYIPSFEFSNKKQYKIIKFIENENIPLFNGEKIQGIKLKLDSRFTLYFENDGIPRDEKSIIPKLNGKTNHWYIYLMEKTPAMGDEYLCDFMIISKYHDIKIQLSQIKLFIEQIIKENNGLGFIEQTVNDL